MVDQMHKNAQRLWASGGTLGAILASSCCIAPLLLLSLGISGAWIGNLTSRTLRRRNILRAARSKPARQKLLVAGNRFDRCIGHRRLVGAAILLGVRKMKKTMIAAVAILGLAGAGIGAATLLPQNSDERVQQNPAILQTASFAVENMTCATCPITVRRAMEGVAGVHEVTIDYETRTATAQFDPERTTTSAIAAASTEAGYPAILSESAL